MHTNWMAMMMMVKKLTLELNSYSIVLTPSFCLCFRFHHRYSLLEISKTKLLIVVAGPLFSFIIFRMRVHMCVLFAIRPLCSFFINNRA